MGSGAAAAAAVGPSVLLTPPWGPQDSYHDLIARLNTDPRYMADRQHAIEENARRLEGVLRPMHTFTRDALTDDDHPLHSPKVCMYPYGAYVPLGRLGLERGACADVIVQDAVKALDEWYEPNSEVLSITLPESGMVVSGYGTYTQHWDESHGSVYGTPRDMATTRSASPKEVSTISDEQSKRTKVIGQEHEAADTVSISGEEAVRLARKEIPGLEALAAAVEACVPLREALGRRALEAAGHCMVTPGWDAIQDGTREKPFTSKERNARNSPTHPSRTTPACMKVLMAHLLNQDGNKTRFRIHKDTEDEMVYQKKGKYGKLARRKSWRVRTMWYTVVIRLDDGKADTAMEVLGCAEPMRYLQQGDAWIFPCDMDHLTLTAAPGVRKVALFVGVSVP